MTKAEAIKELSYIADEMPSMECSDWKEAIYMAIKALEQKDILDKIRTEIDNINLNEVAVKYENKFYGFQREIIKIIDKYKVESEE